MGRETSASKVRARLEVVDYDHTNEVINRLSDGETIKIVQGAYGRVPVIASTDDEAKDRYVAKFMKRINFDADSEVTDED